MPASLQFRIAEDRTEGKTRSILRRLRKLGLSYGEISRRLYADHGVNLSGETLRTWAREWGIE